MTTTPAVAPLSAEEMDTWANLARAVDYLPETTQPFVSSAGQVIIHTFSMSREQADAVARLYDAVTPAKLVALIAQARAAQPLSATSLQSLSRASGEERGQQAPQAPQASVEDAQERARIAGEAVRNAVWGIIGPGFHARLAALDFETIISGAMSATQEGK